MAYSDEKTDATLSVEVTVNRPSTPQIVTFAQSSNAAHAKTTTLKALPGRIASIILSSTFLLLVVAWATLRSAIVALPSVFRSKTTRKTYDWDRPELAETERVTGDARYYAQQIGLDIEVDEITTDDGFILKCVSALARRTVAHDDCQNASRGQPSHETRRQWTR